MRRIENSKWFVPHSLSRAAKINLFCFHHAGGSAGFYSQWPKHLTTMVNVISIQLPGRESRYGEGFSTSIDEIVSELVKYDAVFTDKPYIIFGHSLGALVGFMLARELVKMQKPQPTFFISSAHPAPRRVELVDKLHELPDIEFVQKMSKKYGGISKEVLNSEELLQFLTPRFRADIFLSESNVYKEISPVKFPIAVMHGENDKSVSQEGILAWQNETEENVRFHSFSGDHFFVESQEKEVLGIINKLIAQHLWALEA